MSGSKRYRTVKIPEELFMQIKKLISERKELGYTSIAEFVKEAIREKLRRIE